MTRLRALRQRHLLTQHELARKAGVSVRTICNVERGGACRQTTKRALLKALGLTMENAEQVWPEVQP